MLKLFYKNLATTKRGKLFQENCKEIMKQLLTNNCPPCVDLQIAGKLNKGQPSPIFF
jgi:hypothetical protein